MYNFEEALNETYLEFYGIDLEIMTDEQLDKIEFLHG